MKHLIGGQNAYICDECVELCVEIISEDAQTGPEKGVPGVADQRGTSSALEEAVRGRSRGRLELLTSAVSPDGRWAATLFRQHETNYWLESLYEYDAEGWVEHTTSNGSLAYTGIGEDEEGTPIGVLRYYGEAPSDSQVALIQWRNEIREVPVQRSHFAFAAWDAKEHETDHGRPKVVGFR